MTKYYRGGIEGLDDALLPLVDSEVATDPSGYLPDAGLVDAVNVAQMLQQPLLLTGEPGTGKTQLAFSVARDLELGPPLVFETKSTSLSRDLFYTFDNLRRFHAAGIPGADLDPRQFIQYQALGMAIIRTLDRVDVERLTTGGMSEDGSPRQSLVLIDEIDKAPRDFPNDILNEIENLYFRIPELGRDAVRARHDLRPVVIITSNSEKSLPEPFLRRCVFYNIPFPDDERLWEIVAARVPSIKAASGTALKDAISFFELLREDRSGMRRKPGTAELIAWVTSLTTRGIDPERSLKAQRDIVARTLSTLGKNPEDQDRVPQLFKAWLTS